jgi:excisionase family DNA binding protein
MQSSYTYSNGLIPIGEVAKLLGVTVGTVRRWNKDGRLSAVRTPTGHRRFRRSDVEALLQAETA